MIISNTATDNNVSASYVVDNHLETILCDIGCDSPSRMKNLLFKPSRRYFPQLAWLVIGSCLILTLTLLSLSSGVVEPTSYRNLVDGVPNATLGVR